MSKEEWTEPQEDLLVTWAEKSSGYAWLHQKSVSIYKKRNLKLSIPTAIFGYVAGITILLSNDILNDCENTTIGPIIRAIIGIISITAGILSNFQEMFTFKEEGEKHRIAALRFLSLFREISCELSLDPRFRSAPIDYITLKRFELDKILEQSPSIPNIVICEFKETFKSLSIHKPDPVTGLQTIVPYGKEIQLNKNSLTLKNKITLLKYFTQWKVEVTYSKLKKGIRPNNDCLIEITNSRNSRNSNNDETNTIINNMDVKKSNLLSFGRLGGEKNIKIIKNNGL
jgi:hypothetical protein